MLLFWFYSKKNITSFSIYCWGKRQVFQVYLYFIHCFKLWPTCISNLCLFSLIHIFFYLKSSLHKKNNFSKFTYLLIFCNSKPENNNFSLWFFLPEMTGSFHQFSSPFGPFSVIRNLIQGTDTTMQYLADANTLNM